MSSVHVSVQGFPTDRASWLALAREVEVAGFDGLYVADHPGTVAAPFVALAAAAAVTDRIRLGTCVANAGMWEPVALANEIATLDLVSAGRAVLGVGAGHTPAEWTSTGRPFPSPGERVDRMIELVEATRALLAGATVSSEGSQFTLDDAALANPRPVQDLVPLLIGGNGARVLRYGAQHAERVGITGLARTLADGHRHEVDWSESALAQILEIVISAADAVDQSPQIEVLVQHIEITDDAKAAAARLLPHVPGASVDDLINSPFVWIGTIGQINERLRAHQHNWGIEHYMIRERTISEVSRILASTTPG